MFVLFLAGDTGNCQYERHMQMFRWTDVITALFAGASRLISTLRLDTATLVYPPRM